MNITVIKLAIATVIGNIIGFFRDIILSFFFGASYISEAYIISMNIPEVIISFIGKAITNSILPRYAEINLKDNKNLSDSYFVSIGLFSLLFSAVLMLFVIFNSEFIVRLMVSGFEGEQFLITNKFLKITSPIIILTIFNSLLITYLQLNYNFILPSLVGIPLSFSIIVGTILAFYINIDFLVIFSVLGYIFQTLILIKAVFCLLNLKNVKISFNKDMLLFLKNIIPITIGSSIPQIFGIIDRDFASNIVQGAIAYLNYSSKVYMMVFAIGVIPVSTTYFTKFAYSSKSNDINKFSKDVIESLFLLNSFLIPFSFFLFVNSNEIISVLFGRGAFDENSIKITQNIFKYIILSISFLGNYEILIKSFFSLSRNNIPTFIGIFAIISKLILIRFFIDYFNIFALPLSTLVIYLFMFLSSLFVFSKIIKGGPKLFFRHLAYISLIFLFSWIGVSLSEYVYYSIFDLQHIFIVLILKGIIWALLFAVQFGVVLYFQGKITKFLLA